MKTLVETKSGQTISVAQGHLNSLGDISGETSEGKFFSISVDSFRRAALGGAVVVTKDERTHNFKDLMLRGSGTISGEVQTSRPPASWGTTLQYERTFAVLLLDSVKSISVETFSIWRTVLFVAPIAGVFVLIVGAVAAFGQGLEGIPAAVHWNW